MRTKPQRLEGSFYDELRGRIRKAWQTVKRPLQPLQFRHEVKARKHAGTGIGGTALILHPSGKPLALHLAVFKQL